MSDTKPMVSVEELKLLIYKESGYRMQIREDDPLLSVVYTNLAVIGKALETAATINDKATTAINQLPAIANQEVERARCDATARMAESIDALAHKAGEIAMQVAGTAAETARLEAGWFAALAITLFGTVMVAGGAYVGGSRESWGIGGVVAGGAALGILAGIVIGYYANGHISETRARKAYWDEPGRKAWRADIQRALQK